MRLGPLGGGGANALDVAKKVLLVGLVVLIVFTGVPLLVGGPSGMCDSCGPGVMTTLACAVLVAALTMFVAMMMAATQSPPLRHRRLLWASVLGRPPQAV